MDSGMFFSGGSPYSPRTIFFSALQIRKMLNKTREVLMSGSRKFSLIKSSNLVFLGVFRLVGKTKNVQF